MAGHEITVNRFYSLCTKENFNQEFKTWSSGNANTDKIIQESQINYEYLYEKLQWMPYDNFQNIEHIADGGHGSVYSAKLENGIKWGWNFIKQETKVAVKNMHISINMDNAVMRQLKIADENQKNTSKSQKQELFKLFSYSRSQIWKSADPNLLLKSNEPTALDVNNTYDITY
ncbi:208_t:CDS:2 [Diversispora eburnea]|uniref:208_t:CDS:1 n=1 Tax=Diversispora eburnea TaxID=1213867 RepID=A0A9N9BZV6_9GLOM|nr:208_t:CDS:2 [Diversispora eburnea]